MHRYSPLATLYPILYILWQVIRSYWRFNKNKKYCFLVNCWGQTQSGHFSLIWYSSYCPAHTHPYKKDVWRCDAAMIKPIEPDAGFHPHQSKMADGEFLHTDVLRTSKYNRKLPKSQVFPGFCQFEWNSRFFRTREKYFKIPGLFPGGWEPCMSQKC